MPHLIPSLFEKNYTPYTARLAPKHLWSRPTLGKLSPLFCPAPQTQSVQQNHTQTPFFVINLCMAYLG